MDVTPYKLAQRFVGTKEVGGSTSNPQVLAMLQLDNQSIQNDEVPWCSAFTNYIAWLLRLPRSKNLLARSWLAVGEPKTLSDAEVGFDIVIIKRGGGNQPGPTNLTAQGHTGFFAGVEGNNILILGGNQSDSVSIKPYAKSRLLGIRSITP